ncbi:MAG: acyl-CoA dehydrogenase family protein [Burkholderiaceae bacterium]
MALILNEQQTMLRDSAHDFISENAPVSHLRELRDTRDETGYSKAFWKRCADMGFCGVMVPEEHGGLELGKTEAGIIMEAIGHTLVPTPMLSSSVLATIALRETGTEAQQAQWLPRIASGEAVVALAVDEASRHRPDQLDTRLRKEGDKLLLDGDKLAVIDGHVADILIVAARNLDGDPSLYLVDPKASGVHIERTIMVDAHNAARIRFERVQIDPATLMSGGNGARALGCALDAGRAMLAAEMLGIADEVFARTIAYLSERKQFGQLIGEFQALQHRASHLYCEIEFTRAAVAQALAKLDENPAGAAEDVSIAKARAGATASLAVQEAVQMHGGIGMTDELDIGLFMKRARVCQELLGDDNFHIDFVGVLRGY